MDIDYTCGHKFQMRPGAFPQDCPECGKGMATGVNARFYMSDDLSKKMREAAMSVKPLTGKEQPENKPTFAYYTCGCVLGTEPGGIVPNRCEQCSKGGQFYRSLDHQVEPYAWICPKCHDHNQQICDKCLTCGMAKPVAQEWAGKGRPPVNTRCLARCKHQWRVGTVIWHREGNDVDALLLDDDGHTTFWAWEFRPIRAQVERDKDELNQIIDAAMRSGDGDAAAAILAAGWRKAGDQ